MSDKVKIAFFKVVMPYPKVFAMPLGLSKDANFFMFMRNDECVKISPSEEDPEVDPDFRFDYNEVLKAYKSLSLLPPSPTVAEKVSESAGWGCSPLREAIEQELHGDKH